MIGLMIPSVFAQTPTILVLNPIPATVEAGNEIVFSGKFNTESGNSIQNAEIFIKDDVKFGIDKYIGSITTDENGEFVKSGSILYAHMSVNGREITLYKFGDDKD